MGASRSEFTIVQMDWCPFILIRSICFTNIKKTLHFVHWSWNTRLEDSQSARVVMGWDRLVLGLVNDCVGDVYAACFAVDTVTRELSFQDNEGIWVEAGVRELDSLRKSI